MDADIACLPPVDEGAIGRVGMVTEGDVAVRGWRLVGIVLALLTALVVELALDDFRPDAPREPDARFLYDECA